MKVNRFFLLFLAVTLLFALPAQADVTLPTDTAVIEEQAFMNDTSLLGTLVIPEGVTEIGAEAFCGCTGLTGLTVTSTPIIIGSKAFGDCTGLSGKIYLPEGSTVAEDAFENTDAEVIIGAPEVEPGVNAGMIQAQHTTITIYDYWSGENERSENPTEEEQARYDYEDWIEKNYNVKIQQKQGGDWLTCAEEMARFVDQPDGSLRLYIIEPGKVGMLISGNEAADWGSYDLSSSKWNRAVIELYSKGGKHYAVSTGAQEPHELVYFNKRLLEEAGIDWNSIYDMQANGTWTWAAFEDMLKKTTRDLDQDGVTDVWGFIGDTDVLYRMSVFTNGATFFDYNASGKLQPTMNSTAALSGLNWAVSLAQNYCMPQPEGADWDWYKSAWTQGQCAFYVYYAYGGFNDYSEMSDMADDWGAVAFPVASAGRNYVTTVSENVTLIPNVYTAEEIEKIVFFYDLWTNNEKEVSWVSNMLGLTDRRAVYETYSMLRSASHGVADKTTLLGTVNAVLGANLLWCLGNSSPSALIESAMPTWQALCDDYNQ